MAEGEVGGGLAGDVDAPGAVREPLRKLQAKFGKVLSIHGEMAHAPVARPSR